MLHPLQGVKECREEEGISQPIRSHVGVYEAIFQPHPTHPRICTVLMGRFAA